MATNKELIENLYECFAVGDVPAVLGAIADDIAYDAHDIDDGLRAELFRLDDLGGLAVVGDILNETDRDHPGLEPGRRAHEIIRRLITRMIEDVVAQSRRDLAEFDPASADSIRHAGRPLVRFSPAIAEADRAIKGFLRPRMYRHPRIKRIMDEAEGVIRNLFAHYNERPGDMPAEWLTGLDLAADEARARRIADFIAGMTDRYAMVEHARLFGSTPELR